MRNARLAILGAALGAVATFGTLEVVPHLALVGEVSEALQGEEQARRLPGGEGWIKPYVEGDTKMLLLNAPAAWALGWEPFLEDPAAQRVLACNFGNCVYTPVNGVTSRVVRVYPIPFLTDRLMIDTVDDGPTIAMRTRWDKVVTIK